MTSRPRTGARVPPQQIQGLLPGGPERLPLLPAIRPYGGRGLSGS